ncbi:MAG: type VII toxin-antitoxin system MntA family adenylyltransferase antitoxin [Chloroherpetonaceae bacterium]
MTEEEQDRIVSELTRELAPNKVLGIYLYGSRADGTARAESDWDIGVLTETPTDAVQRWEAAQTLALKLNADVDLVDLRQCSTVMRFQIAGKGRRIYTANRLACETFEYQSLSMYQRFQEERKPIMEEIFKRGKIYR